MNRKMVVFITAGLMLSVHFAMAQSNKKQTDLSKFNGTWKPVKMILGGQETPDEIMAEMRLKLKDGTFEVNSQGEQEKGTFKVNQKTNPMQLDIFSESDEGGEGGEANILGIYKLDGDKMIVCYDTAGTRPEKFESTADNGFLLITYQRQKDDQ